MCTKWTKTRHLYRKRASSVQINDSTFASRQLPAVKYIISRSKVIAHPHQFTLPPSLNPSPRGRGCASRTLNKKIPGRAAFTGCPVWCTLSILNLWVSVDYGEGHEGGDGEGDKDYQPDDEQDEAWVPFRGFEAENQHHAAVEHDEEWNRDHKDG